MIDAKLVIKAVRRSWRLMLALAVIGGLVAVMLPVTTPKVKAKPYPWLATAVAGAESTTGFGKPAVSPTSIQFWASKQDVKLSAIKAAGLSKSGLKLLARMKALTTTLGQANLLKPKTTKSNTAKSGGVVLFEAAGATSKSAVTLVTAYVAAVKHSVDAAFALSQKQAARTGKNLLPGTKSGFTVIRPASRHRVRKLGVVHKTSKLDSKKVRGLIGVLGGVILAVLIVGLREFLDRTMRTSSAAESAFHFPVVAEIPMPPRVGGVARATVLQVAEDPASSSAEAFRMLRMSILFEAMADSVPDADPFAEAGPWAAPVREPYRVPEPGSRQVVLVVSPGTEDTRAVVAANLGAAFGEAGQRVIVISTADIDSGQRGTRALGPPPHVTPADLQAQLQPSRVPNVARLSLRPFVGNSGQLVTAAPVIMAAAREIADAVIIEVPPVLVAHHGEALVHAVDVVVVVGECGATTVSHARRAGDLLRRMGAPVLGVVLTEVRLDKKDLRQTVALPGALPSITAGPEVDAIPEATRA